jgi:hypothetical protein
MDFYKRLFYLSWPKLDNRKQIDKFESSLKTYTAKAARKQKEAIKVCVFFFVSFVHMLTCFADYQCGDGCTALGDEETWR